MCSIEMLGNKIVGRVSTVVVLIVVGSISTGVF